MAVLMGDVVYVQTPYVRRRSRETMHSYTLPM